jgi:hypothetical protein
MPLASPLSPISMDMAVSFLDNFNNNICRTILGITYNSEGRGVPFDLG